MFLLFSVFCVCLQKNLFFFFVVIKIIVLKYFSSFFIFFIVFFFFWIFYFCFLFKQNKKKTLLNKKKQPKMKGINRFKNLLILIKIKKKHSWINLHLKCLYHLLYFHL